MHLYWELIEVMVTGKIEYEIKQSVKEQLGPQNLHKKIFHQPKKEEITYCKN